MKTTTETRTLTFATVGTEGDHPYLAIQETDQEWTVIRDEAGTIVEERQEAAMPAGEWTEYEITEAEVDDPADRLAALGWRAVGDWEATTDGAVAQVEAI